MKKNDYICLFLSIIINIGIILALTVFSKDTTQEILDAEQIKIGLVAVENDASTKFRGEKNVDAKKQNLDADSIEKKEEKTEFNVGDIIAFDGKELTVEKVERNWNSGNSYLKPKDGKEYVKVSVKIENKSETEMNYNVFEFKAEDSNGAAESADGQTYSLPDSLGSGDLVKGGKKSGSMIFEVPAGSSLKLHYQPSFWSNKKVIVNL